MATKFMVLRRDFDLEIYKFPSDQTSRLTEGLWTEDIKLYDDFAEAKRAAIVLVARHLDSGKSGNETRFSFKDSSRARILRHRLTRLTEEEIRPFQF